MQGDSADTTGQPLPTVPGTVLPGGEPAAKPAPALPLRAAGVFLGGPTALLGLLYFVVAGVPLGPLLLWPRTRRQAFVVLTSGARRLTALERWRRSVFFGDSFPDRPVPDHAGILPLPRRPYLRRPDHRRGTRPPRLRRRPRGPARRESGPGHPRRPGTGHPGPARGGAALPGRTGPVLAGGARRADGPRVLRALGARADAAAHRRAGHQPGGGAPGRRPRAPAHRAGPTSPSSNCWHSPSRSACARSLRRSRTPRLQDWRRDLELADEVGSDRVDVHVRPQVRAAQHRAVAHTDGGDGADDVRRRLQLGRLARPRCRGPGSPPGPRTNARGPGRCRAPGSAPAGTPGSARAPGSPPGRRHRPRPRTRLSGRASSLLAIAEAAPVRIAVGRMPSHTASRRPVTSS
ncbi:hypothetical protein SVIOM342S_10358 [Streptomyces violaceorubidus]